MVDVDRGGSCAAAAVGVRPAHGNPHLGARVGRGWAEHGRCNCYMPEPEHAQQLPSHDVPASAVAKQHLLGNGRATHITVSLHTRHSKTSRWMQHKCNIQSGLCNCTDMCTWLSKLCRNAVAQAKKPPKACGQDEYGKHASTQ